MTELTLTTKDGREFNIPEWWEDRNPERFYGLDFGGWPMMRYADTNSRGEDYVIMYGLTECCGATHKGVEGGIGCRKCYNLVEENHDTPWGEISPFVRLSIADAEKITND